MNFIKIFCVVPTDTGRPRRISLNGQAGSHGIESAEGRRAPLGCFTSGHFEARSLSCILPRSSPRSSRSHRILLFFPFLFLPFSHLFFSFFLLFFLLLRFTHPRPIGTRVRRLDQREVDRRAVEHDLYLQFPPPARFHLRLKVTSIIF